MATKTTPALNASAVTPSASSGIDINPSSPTFGQLTGHPSSAPAPSGAPAPAPSGAPTSGPGVVPPATGPDGKPLPPPAPTSGQGSGVGYYDASGNWIYGTKPVPRAGSVDTGNPSLITSRNGASANPTDILTKPYTAADQNADETTVVANRRALQAGEINAINEGFGDIIANDQMTGSENEQAQNALLAATGMLGGGTALADTTRARTQTAQAVNADRAKQATAIAGVLQKIDQDAITAADALHGTQMSDAKTAYDVLAQTKSNAQQNLTDLAKTAPLQWDDFVKQYPDTANNLLQTTGYDPATAAFKWNAAKAAAQQVQWGTPIQTATGLLFTGVDPMTGQIKQQAVDTPGVSAAGDWTVSPANMYQDTLMVNKKTGEIKTLSQYNDSISTNISGLVPDGTVGGECGVFAHTLVDGLPQMGDTAASKMAMIDSQGVKAKDWTSPKIGDVVIFNTGAEGHAAVVNKVLPNGQLQLSESNQKLDGKVTNTRIIDKNDPAVYGAYTKGTMKTSVADGTMTPRQLAVAQKVATLKKTEEGIASTDAMLVNRRNQTVRTVITNLYGSPAKNPAAIYANSAQAMDRINPALKESLDSGTVAKNIPDLDLLDSYVQVARGGGNITEAQVSTVLSGMGLGDTLDIAKQKLSGGAVLSDDQRKEFARLTKEIYDEQGKSAEQAVKQVNDELKSQGIPDQFLLQKPIDLTVSASVPTLTTEQVQSLTSQLQPGQSLATDENGNAVSATQDEINQGYYTDDSGNQVSITPYQ